MSEHNATPPSITNKAPLMLGIGVVCILASFAGFAMNKKFFFHSYLIGFLICIGISCGSLALLMIQHLTGGRWAFIIRRQLEAAAKTIPIVLVLFLPVMFMGMHDLYHWTDTAAVAKDKILTMKQPYLNTGFFMARWAIYLLIWSGMAYVISGWSKKQDQAANEAEAVKLAQHCAKVSGPGLLIFGLSMTFAAVDWVMSLDPHWVSTIFGILIMGGQLLSAFAFNIIMVCQTSKEKPISERVSVVHYHDLGKLMMAFVLLWSYFNLSQFLIIWSGNLPEETIWYLRRQDSGWYYISIAQIFFNFALPFLILLLRNTKRKPERLWKMAAFILFMRIVDLFWLVKPQALVDPHNPKTPIAFSIYFTDILAPVGLLALWVGIFLIFLKGNPILPLKDPYIKPERLAHGH